MRQRVTIAIALACGPHLLVADEPTTALDVTIQKQILDLLETQKRERAMGLILITHDLGVVAGRTDRIAVMYAGRVVERGPTRVLFRDRRHPYTEGLLRSIPRMSNPGHSRLQVIPGRPPDLVALPEACAFAPRCRYAQPRCLAEQPPLFDIGQSHEHACFFPVGTPEGGEALRRLRPEMQMIYQDPISSLNPRRRVNEIVGEGLSIWGRRQGAADRVAETLQSVGIDPEGAGQRRPHEFSGGQCQRICIARALVLEPKLIICDEPVSALDVSVQAQILNLLEDLKARYGLTLVFITHDLAVVKNVSDKVAVMYLGKICEVAAPDRLYAEPAHPYTAALIEAVPEPDPEVPVPPTALEGDLPSPLAPPSGCRFRTRCPRAEARCAVEEPQMRPVGDGRFVACHFPLVDTPPADAPVTLGAGAPAPAPPPSNPAPPPSPTPAQSAPAPTNFYDSGG